MQAADLAHLARSVIAALEAALQDAEAETDGLRRMDQKAVMACTIRREAFNAQAAEWVARLRHGLTGADRTPALQSDLARLQTLAHALATRDATNRALAGRALRFTDAYFNALRPRPQAYDRRGYSTNAAPLSSISQRT